MKTLKIQNKVQTLVDQVEDKLLNFLKDNSLKVGDAIPNETELSTALGVARSVLREALSRLKMIGMIESRTRRKVCRNTRCAFFFFIDYKNRLIFLSCDILRISLIYAFSTSK